VVWAATLAIVTGGLVLVGWTFDSTALRSIGPGWVPMKPNSAVAFVLTGIALLFSGLPLGTLPTLPLTRAAQRAAFLARLCGWLAGLIGLLTLSEYIGHWDLGIDPWLFHEPAGPLSAGNPSRMAPDSALCFVLLAVGAEIARSMRRRKRTLIGAAVLGVLVTALALSDLLSHFAPAIGADEWWWLRIAAIPSATVLAVLGGALVMIAWQEGAAATRWSLSDRTTVAYACGVVLVLFIGLNTSRSVIRLAATARHVAHTEQVLSVINSVAKEAASAQTHARGYVISGDDQYLKSQQAAATRCREELTTLRQLITDPAQQARSAQLAAQVNTVLLWVPQIIESRRTGAAVAGQRDLVNHGENLMDNLGVLIAQMENEEQRLLHDRQRETASVAWFTHMVIGTGTVISLVVFLSVLLGLNHAVTDRRRAAAAQRQSEEKFRDLFESSRDAIITIEPPTWRFTSGNPAAAKLFGANSAAEFVAHAPWELSPERQPDGRASDEKARAMIELTLREGAHSFEWTHRRLGGAEFQADVLMTKMERDGKVVLQATVRDITGHKREEAEMRLQASAMRASANAIVITDQNGNVVWANPAFTTITGYAVSEVLGKNPRVLKSGLHDEAFFHQLWETITDGRVWSGEIVNKRKDGSLYTEEMTITPVHSEHGGISNFIAIKQDISKRKRAEGQLQESNWQLTEALTQLRKPPQ